MLQPASLLSQCQCLLCPYYVYARLLATFLHSKVTWRAFKTPNVHVHPKIVISESVGEPSFQDLR